MIRSFSLAEIRNSDIILQPWPISARNAFIRCLKLYSIFQLYRYQLLPWVIQTSVHCKLAFLFHLRNSSNQLISSYLPILQGTVIHCPGKSPELGKNRVQFQSCYFRNSNLTPKSTDNTRTGTVYTEVHKMTFWKGCEIHLQLHSEIFR
jgi:hypothetical protein